MSLSHFDITDENTGQKLLPPHNDSFSRKTLVVVLRSIWFAYYPQSTVQGDPQE